MVTLPLKRMEVPRSDVHPQILLQQHINRASKRLALMSGRDAPSVSVMTEALRKRVLAIEGPEGLERRRVGLAGASKSEKRFNRTGVTKPEKRHKKGGKKAKAAAAAAAAGAAGAGTAAVGNNGSAAGSASGAAAGGAAGGAGAAAQPAGAIGGPDSATGLEVANQPTTANSLGLNIEGPDVGYLATVQMGTPPQNFLILMDSGSADLWVASEACQSTAGGDCGNHQTLGSQSSSSFQASNTPFQVTYGTGAVSGAIIQDDISIAGLTLKAHTFGSTLSEQKTATPIEALASQGLVPAAITSYKISRALDAKNDGEITFGALDQTKFDPATLTVTPNVNTQGFWESALDAITVDGQDTGLAGRTGIMDTGTTLIVAPVDDATAVHNLIQGSQADGQGGFTVPCTFNQSIALTLNGNQFAIDPRDIAIQPVDPNDPTGDCISGISGGNIGGATEWLVGDVFLKNAYYSTDVGKNTLTFAKLV
ncbi:aspartic peptidase A1 [Mycena leptocephala]|nr:aspartic peptidase A1 [Mycena leptocephala]